MSKDDVKRTTGQVNTDASTAWPEGVTREEGIAHEWWVYRGLTCCRNCGIVQRADGKNKPCRGKVSIGLRDAPDSSPQHLAGGEGDAVASGEGVPEDVHEWILHLDLHLTEHDERHAGLALRSAWPHVKAYLMEVRNERDTWKELAKNAEAGTLIDWALGALQEINRLRSLVLEGTEQDGGLPREPARYMAAAVAERHRTGDLYALWVTDKDYETLRSHALAQSREIERLREELELLHGDYQRVVGDMHLYRERAESHASFINEQAQQLSGEKGE